jgi:hypothetical protein
MNMICTLKTAIVSTRTSGQKMVLEVVLGHEIGEMKIAPLFYF